MTTPSFYPFIMCYRNQCYRNQLSMEKTASREYLFLRHSKLSLPYQGHDAMPLELLAKLGTDAVDTGIEPGITAQRLARLDEEDAFDRVAAIYHGPARRSKETAAAILGQLQSREGGIILGETALAREISFDLLAMARHTDLQRTFAKSGIHAVNTAVFEAMLRGDDAESIGAAYGRTAELFAWLDSLPHSGRTVLVTHDFFMRVIEIYAARGAALDIGITLRDLEATGRNGYLEGFLVERSGADPSTRNVRAFRQGAAAQQTAQ